MRRNMDMRVNSTGLPKLSLKSRNSWKQANSHSAPQETTGWQLSNWTNYYKSLVMKLATLSRSYTLSQTSAKSWRPRY